MFPATKEVQAKNFEICSIEGTDLVTERIHRHVLYTFRNLSNPKFIQSNKNVQKSHEKTLLLVIADEREVIGLSITLSQISSTINGEIMQLLKHVIASLKVKCYFCEMISHSDSLVYLDTTKCATRNAPKYDANKTPFHSA
jgi:hypothetical protein